MTDLKATVLFDLDAEFANTRRVLERAPDDQLSWKPHPKSFSLGSLGAHIANLVGWQTTTLTTTELDLGVERPRTVPPASTAELLETFDRNLETFRATFAEADDESLSAMWTLRFGERVLLAQPRVQVLRGSGLSHLIHHRGQFTVYLRLLDVPVPGLYGPTADEQ